MHGDENGERWAHGSPPRLGIFERVKSMNQTRRWTTFDALRDRNYRWLWTSSLASSALARSVNSSWRR